MSLGGRAFLFTKMHIGVDWVEVLCESTKMYVDLALLGKLMREM